MSPKEAVQSAKRYIADLFADDGAMNVGLEELRFDNESNRWSVTIGFTRAWEGPQGISRYSWQDRSAWPRIFKTVDIDDQSGDIVELKHRSIAA